jgi:hypothetical protein
MTRGLERLVNRIGAAPGDKQPAHMISGSRPIESAIISTTRDEPLGLWPGSESLWPTDRESRPRTSSAPKLRHRLKESLWPDGV